jgi:hypothetical protein
MEELAQTKTIINNSVNDTKEEVTKFEQRLAFVILILFAFSAFIILFFFQFNNL